MASLDSILSARLDEISARGQRRSLVATQMTGSGRIERGGADFLDFSSNDYLGLSRHPLLAERAREWTARMGTGAGASRLITGTSQAHLDLEAKTATFKQTEAALLFATGWQANAAAIPALLSAIPGAAVFTDRLVHASIHQGLAAAGARQVRFAHNGLDSLETRLESSADAPARFILTESVFSMDGDRADIARLADIARRHDAFLFVDEAHATGVLGPRGAGLCAGLDGIAVVMGTFSKALGGFGAYVAGSQILCDYLVNRCSGFIYTTAPPPAVLGAIDAALDLVPGMETERAHLAALGDRLRQGLAGLGIATGASSTQIVPAIIGAESDAMRLAEALAADGLLASAIRPPTVPNGTSRLRLALRATHGDGDIDRLLAAIGAHL